MPFYVLFALLALCSGQTSSPTTSPSPTPTPGCLTRFVVLERNNGIGGIMTWEEIEAFDSTSTNVLLNKPYQWIGSGCDNLIQGNDGVIACSYTRAYVRTGADGWSRMIYDLQAEYYITSVALRGRECNNNNCGSWPWSHEVDNSAIRFLSIDQSATQIGVSDVGNYGLGCLRKSWPVSCGPWPSPSNSITPSVSCTPTQTSSTTQSLTLSPTTSPTATVWNNSIPCPSRYYCFLGRPVLCPAGNFCPLSSINATLCPIGTFSNPGASNCTLCLAGTFTIATGSTSCQQCPGGHYCPTGTSFWASLNCGKGNYCPDGSGAPTPCPFQVPPTGGWGALQVQGPAFLVETAHCLNHCFWNLTSGDGMLSKC